MRLRPALLGTVATLLLTGGLLPGCGKEKSTPGLMLSFTSDMSVPKDVTAVGLYIRTKTGGVIYNNVVEASVDASGNRTVRFPSTFAILSNGSPATVRVQLIAYGKVTTAGGTTNRKAIVMRESTTGVPTDRLSLLRMPLLWINQGSVAGGSAIATTTHSTEGLHALSGSSIRLLADEAQYRPEEGYKSPCGENQSWIGGKCRTIDPSAPLPDYTEADAPGGTGGTCFSVETCFSAPTSLREKIRDDGTLDIGDTHATKVNLALVTKDEIGIKLPDGRFAISLDSDSEFEGYTIANDRITLSDAVREALKSGRATDLLATTTCGPKTADIVNCGPWNPATANVETRPAEPIGGDGGTPLTDAGADGALSRDGGNPIDGGDGAAPLPQGEPQGPSEPRMSGLAMTQSTLYTMRDDNGGNPTGLRLTPKGSLQSNGVPNSPALAGGPYRIALATFPGGANTPWAGKSWIFMMTAASPQGHIYYTEVGSNTIAELPSIGTLLPIAMIPSTKMPIFVGPSGVTPAAIGFPNVSGTQAFTFSGLTAGETPTAAASVVDTDFVLGTANSGDSTARVRSCTINVATYILDCSQSLATTSQGVPVDIAIGSKIYALVVRNEDPEQGWEGIYEISNNMFKAQALKSANGLFHFEPGGLGAVAGTGFRNRIALVPNQPFAFVSTAQVGGTKSQIFKFDLGATPNAAVPVATGLTRALDVQADETHVYYVDYGAGQGMSDGHIYRTPWK